MKRIDIMKCEEKERERRDKRERKRGEDIEQEVLSSKALQNRGKMKSP